MEVRGADAGLDRALAELVELLRGRQRLREAAETTGAVRAALADHLLAEDLRRGDLPVPGALTQAAVTSREADAVLVAERAQVSRPWRLPMRVAAARERIARIAVELDVLDPLRLQEREQRSKRAFTLLAGSVGMQYGVGGAGGGRTKDLPGPRSGSP